MRFLPKKSLKAGELSLYFRQMAVMLGSGIDMESTLKNLAEESENGPIRELSRFMGQSIDADVSPRGIRIPAPEWILGILTAISRKSATGKEIPNILYDTADDLETMDNLSKRFVGLMTYPVATLIIAAIIISIMMVFVLPSFQELFYSFNSTLPAPTALLIKLSSSIKRNGSIIILSIFIFFAFFQKNRRFRDFLQLSIPGLRRHTRHYSMVQFTRYLSIMLKLDEPVERAFETAANAVSNTFHSKKFHAISHSAIERTSIPVLLAKTGIFPSLALRMMTAGAQSGTLETTLGELARYYEKIIQADMNILFVRLEIFIGVILSTFIGGLVISMYLPIFKMAAAVGG
jgi:type IV pilus assembly protein PilC